MIDDDPLRLLGEIEARWPQATAHGRTAMIQLWSSAARIFSNSKPSLDDALIDRYFDLRCRLFPGELQVDPAIQSVAKRTGRLRPAVALILNPCLRAELMIKLGDVQWVQTHGTPGTKETLRKSLESASPGMRKPLDTPVPDWIDEAVSGDAGRVRARMLEAGDKGAVIYLDRVFGDPRLTQDQAPSGLSLASCLWQHAVASGASAEAAHWEGVLRRRDPDRSFASHWVSGLLEPIMITAASGRRDEARRLAEALRAEPRTSWNGSATDWGVALCGGDVAVLPDIVFPQQLLAALRAELAGEAAAPGLWRAWFDLALPSHSITSMSLLRLAWWRSHPQR